MNALFFFLSFSLFTITSEYDFTFKEIQEISSSFLAKNNKNEKWIMNNLLLHCPKEKKTDYGFDLKHNIGTCLQTIGTNYQILFFNGFDVCNPHKFKKKIKPLCFTANNNLLLTLYKDNGFSFIKIPSLNGRFWSIAKEVEIPVAFDDSTNETIKSVFLSDNNVKIDCYPGEYGDFYLKTSTEKLFLLTIREKAQLSLTEKFHFIQSVKIPIENKNFHKRESGEPSKKFFTSLKIISIGLMVGFLSIIVFYNYFKIKSLTR